MMGSVVMKITKKWNKQTMLSPAKVSGSGFMTVLPCLITGQDEQGWVTAR